MTAYQLEIFLHHYITPVDFPRKDAPAYEVELSGLINTGLLFRDKGGIIKATQLGQVFMRMILSTKVPTEKTIYVDEHGKEINLSNDSTAPDVE